MLITTIIAAVSALAVSVKAVQYGEYILAPRSRTVFPASVHRINGSVSGAESLLAGSIGSATLTGQSAVTYDFGKNVAGIVSIDFGPVPPNTTVAVTFSESSMWVSGVGSDATADAGIDEALLFNPTAPGILSATREHERGGFRYLSLINNGTIDHSSAEIRNLTIYYTPMPHWQDDQLSSYTGYFHTDDELLNRIWYAGAYTIQMCTIDPHYGNALVHLFEVNSTQAGDSVPPLTWYNNYTIANSSSALVDGAKRDRLLAPGDMSVALPGLAVSTYDLITVANSLDSLFSARNTTTGQLPYAGFPFPPLYSATYHLYSLIGVADYYLYSGNLSYLQQKWPAWKQGLDFSLSFIDATGLMNVTSPFDWLRSGMGGHNIEANAILYYTINQGIALGKELNETSLLRDWTEAAETIKTAVNDLLWSPSQNLYTDNETTTLCPQDGNAWSILANLTSSAEHAALVSQSLSERWGTYGAPAPEAKDPKFPELQTISPFIGSFELQSHFLSSQPSRAIELIRRQWGFMLDDPRMTNSTFIEGYSSDGSLHYSPYTNDARISHAHGWSSGPTSVMTMYLAGLRVISAGGAEWEVGPQLGGGVTKVEAGYQTAKGLFAIDLRGDSQGHITALSFQTPEGTTGRVVLGAVEGSIRRDSDGKEVVLVLGTAENVEGGSWKLVESTPATTNGGRRISLSLLCILLAVIALVV